MSSLLLTPFRTMLLLALSSSSLAHTAPPLKDSQLPRPSGQFSLPFGGPAGPDTWLVGQVYGNTTGAYTMRSSGYRSGQGIHFGLDFAAPCGTPVLAIGDGVVQEVDGTHGSPPHNLVIHHGNGLSSLYGHLLEKPSLKVGQKVKRGQVVARSGDSESTCRSSPHLHLEIRDTSHVRFFNPMFYIQADWDTLHLQGAFYRGFQRDLADVRKWQFPEDQPQAVRGGPLLNRFALSWPPDQVQNTPQQGKFTGYQALQLDWPTRETRLTDGGCCALPEFTPDSSRIRYLDRPDRGSPLGWYAAGPQLKPQPLLPLGFPSPDLSRQVLPATGKTVLAPEPGNPILLPGPVSEVFWSADSQRFAWNQTTEKGTWDVWPTTLWLWQAGEPLRPVLTVYGGGVRGFLDPQTLVVSGKRRVDQPQPELFTLDLTHGQTQVLDTSLFIQGVSVSPGGTHVAYFLAGSKDRRNGVFVANRAGQRTQVPVFGSYRWRNDNTLLMVPLRPTDHNHTVHQWQVGDAALTPLVQLAGKISCDQWVVSPSGEHLAYVRARDHNIYGIRLP